MSADLNALLERVRKASGADRFIDALIEAEGRRQEAYRVGLDDGTRAHWKATIDGDVFDTSTAYAAPRFTSSIDAAVDLVGRCFRHAAQIDIQVSVGAAFHSCSIQLVETGDWISAEQLRSPALAVVAALLLALQSNEATNVE